ncbi:MULTISPECIES: hypothetical protein [Nocardia]|uniref:Uncharacterized protein n=1 Tax=Nocardia thailandica TaxID=257275 RepID=A0ABW6PWA7_9NOCA|nr:MULTISPECIES: hypothetical protein [Nocardia]
MERVDLDQVSWALFSVDVELNGSIVRADSDPGVIQWSGSARYTVGAEDYDEQDFPEGEDAPRWDTAIAKGRALSLHEQQQDYACWSVLQMSGVLVDLGTLVGDVVEQLDSISADYEAFSPVFAGNELHPDLLEMVEGFGNRVVLIDRVNLAPAWRGAGGVGRVLISRILGLFTSTDTGVVATIPYPIVLFDESARLDLEQHPRFGEELERVRRVWASIGFRPYRNDIWVMDPAKVHHDNGVRAIEARLPGLR